MRFRILTISAALSLALPLLAQQQQQPSQQPPPQQQQAGPRPKTQKESDALQKVLQAQQAQNWDGEIQAINYVLENFADTQYKPLLLSMAVDAAQNKNDYAQTIAFGEQAIEADPNNITARVVMAEDIAQHTRENDLDKETSLKKVDDYANKALELGKSTTTPPAGMNPQTWPETQKLLMSQCYDALGQAADLRKKYPEAITNFKTAVDTDANNTIALARLSKAYNDNKQYDDAIAAADKVLAMPNLQPAIKSYAQQEKTRANTLKAAGAKTAPPPPPKQ
ncbi:MAG TPA: tetratricopeptide repeat protein [Bryobacteraceae bacterium]|jgi:tetratricopeptide (TPR) repeat protein|nr:tetratricopeptide repeat protein [Bryobacteraceae bacterium]